MRSYEQSIREFGYEIADDLIRKRDNIEWSMTFDRIKVAESLSSIYKRDIRSTIDDLENSIKRSTKKITESIEYRSR